MGGTKETISAKRILHRGIGEALMGPERIALKFRGSFCTSFMHLVVASSGSREKNVASTLY